MVIEEVRDAIKSYLEERRFTLIELICRQEGSDFVLRVLADRAEGGINLDDCAELNDGVGNMLDELGIPDRKYILEVSSPGLDRPLSTLEDFNRCAQKRVRVFLKEPQDGKWEIEGAINRAAEDFLYLDIGPGSTIEIPFAAINKAKQVV